MQDRLVYLDNNATTPLHPEVKKTIIECMDYYGNASSMHSFGRKTSAMLEQARANIASFINADPEEIIFVGSGSEANNSVLNVVACSNKECSSCLFCSSGRKRVITTTIEHPCVLNTAKCLKDKGKDTHFVPVDGQGRLDLDSLAQATDEHTSLVSVMMCNNEIGTIQDIRKIAALAHEKGALFHTDAVQGVGKIPVDVRELGVDFLSFSAHKMYGPKGVGALYVRKGTPFCPFIMGGHQEHGRRAGTENTLGIFAFSKAVDMRRIEMIEEKDRLGKLREKLASGILDSIPDAKINGHPTETLHNTLNVSFTGAEGEAILLYLDACGIAVSTGSACATGSLEPSHVLLATGMDHLSAHGSIRISLGRENTEEDVDYMLHHLPEVIGKIRRMSTTYKAGGNSHE